VHSNDLGILNILILAEKCFGRKEKYIVSFGNTNVE
jgi:hypothetical protein